MSAMDTNLKSPREPIALGRDDLFAVLDQAFRRHRGCRACSFSLPEPVAPRDAQDANWTVIPSAVCSEECRDVLEQLIARYQSTYRLKHP